MTPLETVSWEKKAQYDANFQKGNMSLIISSIRNKNTLPKNKRREVENRVTKIRSKEEKSNQINKGNETPVNKCSCETKEIKRC